MDESIGAVFYPRDPSEMKGCNFMRVWVAMDISKPLYRGRCVTWNQGSDEWNAFKYERLPNLCYWCGLMSHDDKDFLVGIQSSITRSQEVQQCGGWLRAAQFNPSKKTPIRVLGYEVV